MAQMGYHSPSTQFIEALRQMTLSSPKTGSTYFDVKIKSEHTDRGRALRISNYSKYIDETAKRSTFLEIGPGSGTMIEIARNSGFQNFLIYDNDKGVVDHIQNRFGINSHLTHDVIHELASVPDFSIDLSVATHVLEHFPSPDLIRLLSVLRNKLAVGGIFLVEMPNIACPLGGVPSFYSDATHRSPLTSEGLLQAFRLAGWSDVEARPFRPPFRPGFLISYARYLMTKAVGTVANILGGVRVIRSPSYFIVARAAP
ncbi:class I SAM-dependent methyltransferase [Sandaracinobacter neustonicus]|uniref:Class I SAM-dependent methyltransferase n=1 Tax=Sandaracinobacter neustonicus TaxID=1715348 RepID=A0A501XSK9_9SPHN|nr:class I SAM-dependent methyltransferase [Sandaracinobacter neustonicus]TPE63658.1 class I SAM-dependent methyltransferase [Sandaracinobacter neustonicus]